VPARVIAPHPARVTTAHPHAGEAARMLDPISPALATLRRECMVAGGAVADYIPQLALADPGHFAIALGSLDGDVYSAGDDDVAFTIQSVSKPFVHALGVAALGLATV